MHKRRLALAIGLVLAPGAVVVPAYAVVTGAIHGPRSSPATDALSPVALPRPTPTSASAEDAPATPIDASQGTASPVAPIPGIRATRTAAPSVAPAAAETTAAAAGSTVGRAGTTTAAPAASAPLPTGGTRTTAPATAAARAAAPATAAAPTAAARTAARSIAAGGGSAALTRPDHVVILVEENHSYEELASLPYFSSVIAEGTALTSSYAVTHPSQPNYLALWSGSKQGVADDSCPHDLGSTPSLGSQLIAAGFTVGGYQESMPSRGYTGCSAYPYVRKHNPLADFAATAGPAINRPFSDFPSDFSALPTVSLVVPDMRHDMHDGSKDAGDAWLRDNLGAYAAWAQTHNSMLIVTADEDDQSSGNRILTVLSGEHVRSGIRWGQRVDHVGLLHTLEDAYGLARLGSPSPGLGGIWR